MSEFDDRKKAADAIIEKYLPAEEGDDKTLLEAMNYSVRVGGKRLRPILLQSFGRMYGASDEMLEPFMAAIEMIHTYSLVHDDLPAMDNDMLRRGNPTTHARYGEAMAILAGDGLLSEAFSIMSNAVTGSFFKKKDLMDAMDNAISSSYAMRMIAETAGIKGMVGGQSLDVETDKLGRDITSDEMAYIYSNKTSALLRGAMLAGALLGNNAGDDLEYISTAGEKIGLAFQIRDDILDIEGDEKVLGKETGQDKRNGKSTFASVHGIEASEKQVRRLTQAAKDDIEQLSNISSEEERQFVLGLFDRLTERNK